MSWIRGLNPEQVEAVQHTHGPLLILAGAGSGKTTVLVNRTGRLIDQENIKPERMCVLTFTNKAARELKHRVSHRIGPQAQKVWAGTFHSFGLQILKRFHRSAELPQNFGILDQTDSQALIREILKEIKVVGKDNFDTDKLLNMVQKIRTGERLDVDVVEEYRDMAEAVAPKYIKRLSLLGVVDFESLLLKPLELLKTHPEIREKMQTQFDQVMVDEFQDTNAIQMKLIHELVEKHRNVTVVGDDDQSIYGWRGAEVKNILQFPMEYKPCKVIKLERNYRSQVSILNLANEVISKNHSRHGKVLRSEKSLQAELPELFVHEQEEDESEFVVKEMERFLRSDFKPKDLAVLYRSNTQGAFLESALRRAQIDYSISGGTSIFDRKEAKDLMAFLKQALTPNDVSLKRIINLPSRGIGEVSLEKLTEFAKLHRVSFHEACDRADEVGLPPQSGEALREWIAYLKTWPDRLLDLKGSETPGSIFLKNLEDIGYKQEVFDSAKTPGSGEKKWMVPEVFARILDGFLKKRDYSKASLKEFVEVMTLRLEDSDEEEVNKVQLMTLHASKGLEFPVVFLIGLEEDILPHRSLGGNIDEERRLFYVGITRAQQKLIMTRCSQRRRHGALRPVSPSRFIVEISPQFFKEYPSGVRPVQGEARDSLVSSFLASLDSKTNKGRSI